LKQTSSSLRGLKTFTSLAITNESNAKRANSPRKHLISLMNLEITWWSTMIQRSRHWHVITKMHGSLGRQVDTLLARTARRWSKLLLQHLTCRPVLNAQSWVDSKDLCESNWSALNRISSYQIGSCQGMINGSYTRLNIKMQY